MNEKHGFSMIIMRLVVLLVALAVKCVDGVLDEKIGRNLVDLSWEHESGCMVLVPQISASQEEFYSLSDPKEGTLCTSLMRLKVFYTNNDFEGNTGECVSASVCSYELRCEYRDYTELCGIETVAELQNYRQNCVALGVLANVVDDKVFEPGMVCRPEDIDQNTPKMTPSPISGTTMRPSTPPPTSVQEPADTSGSTQTFNRLLQYAALLLAAFYGM